MAVLNYITPFSEDVTLTFTFDSGQATTTSSTGSFYPFGPSGLGYGLTSGEDNSNQYSFSILDFSVLSEQSVPFSITYSINGVNQPILVSNINQYSQSLGSAEKHLKSSATIPTQTGFSLLAYPLSTVSSNASVTEEVTMSLLVIPPKVS